MKVLDEIFGTNFMKMKDISERLQKIIAHNLYMDGLLPVITLQYFAEKLKYETLKNLEYKMQILKKK